MVATTVITKAVMKGTAAERAAHNTSDIPDNQEVEWQDTDTGFRFRWDGTAWRQIETGGAINARMLGGTGAVSKDKEIEDLGVTPSSSEQEVTWTAGENVTSVTITVFSAGTTSAATLDDGVAITWNYASPSIRDTNLLPSSGNRKVVLIGQPRTFDIVGGGAPFTSLGAIGLADNGAGVVHVLIEAN